ncbi:MAG: hypothetical protein AB7I59_15625 [Geminicoccaceae bacterium]
MRTRLLDAARSKPRWPPRIVPPKVPRNVLLIMTDDSGFGVPSTFGGVIPTPATLAFNSMSGLGRGGEGVLKVDGKEVARRKTERTIPLILQQAASAGSNRSSE